LKEKTNKRYYRARDTEIIEAKTGTQICIILPTNCTKKLCKMLAKYAAEKLNQLELEK